MNRRKKNRTESGGRRRKQDRTESGGRTNRRCWRLEDHQRVRGVRGERDRLIETKRIEKKNLTHVQIEENRGKV